MSRLRRADYVGLAGKTVRCFRWSDDPDCQSLAIDFTDGTRASFRFRVAVEDEIVLGDAGRRLAPVLVWPQTRPLEGE
jgi:hypothetical protein